MYSKAQNSINCYPIPHHASPMFSSLTTSCWDTGAGVHMMFVPLFCHANLLHVLTKSAATVGVQPTAAPPQS